MAQDNTIKLFDLQLSTGATISPFVWATKYALKHKGFDIDIVPGGFTGIRERTKGFHDRVPVIVDDGQWVKDSWEIAEYLDEKYPERPMLLGGDSMKVLDQVHRQLDLGHGDPPWFSCYILDYHNLSLPQDQATCGRAARPCFSAGASSKTSRPAAKNACRWCRRSSNFCASSEADPVARRRAA